MKIFIYREYSLKLSTLDHVIVGLPGHFCLVFVSGLHLIVCAWREGKIFKSARNNTSKIWRLALLFCSALVKSIGASHLEQENGRENVIGN